MAKAGFDPIYGRTLRRAIQQKIEDALPTICQGDFAAGDSVLCTLEGEEYRFPKRGKEAIELAAKGGRIAASLC